MELDLRATTEQGLTDDELSAELTALLERHPAKKVLILPPDYTRYYSKAGFLTQVCYSFYTARGAQVDLLPTLGTHRPMTRAEATALRDMLVRWIFRHIRVTDRAIGDTVNQEAFA